MSKHTEIPWKQSNLKNIGWTLIEPDNGDACICKILSRHAVGRREEGDFDEEESNAEFIVQACNSHDELLEACKFAFENLKPSGDIKQDFDGHLAIAGLSKAIFNAEGGKP